MPVDRLELVRTYLLDTLFEPSGMFVPEDSRYLWWNFTRACQDKIDAWDREKKNDRIVIKLDAPEAHLIHSAMWVDATSKMTEIREKALGGVVHSPERFLAWFTQSIMGPIINEQERCLAYSSSRRIYTVHRINAYISHVAGVYGFKAWEMVHFPDAERIPARNLLGEEVQSPIPK